MFLLCNGLVAFIATTSGLIGSFPTQSQTDIIPKPEKSTTKKSQNQRQLQLIESIPIPEQQKGCIAMAKVIPSEVDSLALVRNECEEEQRNQVDQDEGLIELNKKCEEFIRRMKKGIELEAQQLILVQ